METITLILLFLISTTSSNESNQVYPGHGTFLMNGIFPVTHHGKINYQSGVMMAEAMKYAVDVINNQSNYLYGYKLGILKMFDLHEDSKVSDAVLATFMLDVPFLIGPYSSETSYITSILTRTFRQCVVSYGASYSGFDHSDIYETYMVRTVPSNRFRMEALLAMVRRLNWNYIGVVNSYGYDGEQDARYFISMLTSIGACLAEQIDLPRKPVMQSYENALNKFHFDPRLKAIILFTNNVDSNHIFVEIDRLKLHDRFYIVCVYGCTNYIEVVNGIEKAALGTISLDIHNPEIPDFKSYFLKQNPHMNKQRYFRKVWENLFNCSIPKPFPFGFSTAKPCTKNETLKLGRGYYTNTPVHSVINAVYSVANAIKMLLSYFCKVRPTEPFRNCSINPGDRKIYSHTAFTMLRNMSFIDGTVNTYPWSKSIKQQVRYDIHNFRYINGSFRSVLVGEWYIDRPHIFDYADDVLRKEVATFNFDEDLILLTSTSENATTSAICSQKCPPLHKQVKDYNTLKVRCCWTCQECPDNSVGIGYHCIPCRRTEVANIETNTCLALPQYHISFNDSSSVIIVLLSIVGFCCTTVVNYLFIHFRHNSVVRASGRELSHMLLLGISLTFICPFFYLVKPTNVTCVIRGTLPGLAFLICYAPLFLKTNRIYRIFQNAQKSVTRPNLVSPKSQLFVLLGIVAVQLLLAGVWYASKLPAPISNVSSDRKYITIHCEGDSSPILMLLNLTLSVMFMMSCTVLAFKTRKFPKNYNEAKYIGISLYITCVAWAVLLPAFFLASEKLKFAREYMMCSICIIIGYITLSGLYIQKVKMIFYPEPLENLPKMLSVSNHQQPMKSIYLQKDMSSSQQNLKSFTDEQSIDNSPQDSIRNGNLSTIKI